MLIDRNSQRGVGLETCSWRIQGSHLDHQSFKNILVVPAELKPRLPLVRKLPLSELQDCIETLLTVHHL